MTTRMMSWPGPSTSRRNSRITSFIVDAVWPAEVSSDTHLTVSVITEMVGSDRKVGLSGYKVCLVYFVYFMVFTHLLKVV